MSEYITITGLNEVRINTTEEARHARDSILELTRPVSTVSNPDQALEATNLLKDTKALTRLVEDARTAAKAPVLEQGRKIDALAKELTGELELEAGRLSRLIGGYNAEVARKAAAAAEAARLEEQRIREANERLAAEAAEVEAAKQAELERKASVAKTDQAAERYRLDAEISARKAKEAEEARQAELERATQARALAAAPVAKPAGIATRPEIRFEVKDATALYEAAPFLVILTPNVTAIKAALKTLTGDQKLPGVNHWIEHVAVVNGRR